MANKFLISAKEIVFVQERTRRRGGRSSLYRLEGFSLYIFLILISALIFLSLFILYDQWLYQSKYQQLYESWERYRGQQKKLDKLTSALADSEAVPGEQARSAAEIKAGISKNLRITKEIGVSLRHPELIELKKELVNLNDRLYKLSKLEKKFAKKTKKDSTEAELAMIRRLNIGIYKKEISVSQIMAASLPFDRKPLDGVALSNIIPAAKELY